MNSVKTVRAVRRDISVPDRRTAFLIFAFLFACYLLTYTGTIQSSDGLAMFATVESMVRRGAADANQLLWSGLQQGTFGPDGNLYSRKGIGMSLLAWPFVWFAHAWTGIGLVHAALLLNPFLTAWTAALVFRSAIRLGWSRSISTVTALTYGLATLAWPYTQTFFSDPVAAWGLFGAFYGLLSHQQSNRKRYIFLGSIAWGFAYLARAINLLTLPIFVAILVVILARRRGELDFFRGGMGAVLRRCGQLFTEFPRHWIIFSIPVVAAGLVSLWWNWFRFGHVLESGYLETEAFNGDWLFGVFGLLLSPGRGLVWYSPVLLLALWGGRWFWRRARWPLMAVGVLVILYVLVYGKWYMWHGGFSWGPRFLVPILPFLALLTAPVWDDLLVQGSAQRLPRIAAGALLLGSLGVQWLGMMAPFGLVQNWLAAHVTPLFAPETFVRVADSPLILQWRFLEAQTLQFAWWRLGPDWFSFGLVFATVIAGGVFIVRQVGEEDRGELASLWVYGAAVLLATFVLLVRYQLPFSGSENSLIARRIAQLEQPGDVILHLRPAETQQFANVYHGALAVYGFAPAERLDDFQRSTLQRLLAAHQRIWLLPDRSLPEHSGWERTLRMTSFLLLDETVPPDDRRLALYATADVQPLTEVGLGADFGAPPLVRLNGYGFTKQTRPGGPLLIALEWESLQPTDRNYQVFVHLRNAAGEKIAQRDGQPVLWMRPTSTWQPGEHLVDRYALLLPKDIPPGVYSVAVGLYDPASGERLPVSAGRQDAAIELGPIQIGP